MECQDVRSLLTFARRGCEQLDAAEREALQAHLDKCPDCSAITQAERRLDETLGQVMRDVPIPGGLHASVLKRLAAERRPAGWKRIAGVAAAAAVLLLIVGGAVWYTSRVSVSLTDVTEFAQVLHDEANRGNGWEVARVEAHFQDHGLPIKFPGKMDPQHLRHIDIVEFKHRRVAKLTFRGESGAKADVIILPHAQFRTEALPEEGADPVTNFRILQTGDAPFTYLMFYSGDLNTLFQREV